LREIGYYDGQFGAPGELKVPLEERGFLFGEGVYEFTLAYNGILWGAEDHLDRLERSLRLMEMPLPLPRPELISLMEKAVAMVEGPARGVYLQITRGAAPRAHSYLNISGSKLMMVVRTFDEHREYLGAGYTAITVPDIRWQHCDIKTLNLIPNTMATAQAEKAGAHMAIFVRDNLVIEGASYNIFMVKDNVAYTAPLSDRMLHGVTRLHLVKLLPELGVTLKEEYFTLQQLLEADEVFATSAAVHPAPIVRVDGRAIADGRPGPLAARIDAAYERLIEARCGKRY